MGLILYFNYYLRSDMDDSLSELDCSPVNLDGSSNSPADLDFQAARYF